MTRDAIEKAHERAQEAEGEVQSAMAAASSTVVSEGEAMSSMAIEGGVDEVQEGVVGKMEDFLLGRGATASTLKTATASSTQQLVQKKALMASASTSAVADSSAASKRVRELEFELESQKKQLLESIEQERQALRKKKEQREEQMTNELATLRTAHDEAIGRADELEKQRFREVRELKARQKTDLAIHRLAQRQRLLRMQKKVESDKQRSEQLHADKLRKTEKEHEKEHSRLKEREQELLKKLEAEHELRVKAEAHLEEEHKLTLENQKSDLSATFGSERQTLEKNQQRRRDTLAAELKATHDAHNSALTAAQADHAEEETKIQKIETELLRQLL